MWFLIPVAAVAVGLAFLYDSVTEEEKRAAQSWKEKRNDLERSIEEHERNIRNYLNSCSQILNYHEMTNYHYSSVQVANAAHKLMTDSKATVQGLNNLISKTNSHRKQLQKEIELAKQEGNKQIVSEKIKEIKIVNTLRKQQFDDRDILKQQTEDFHKKLKELNIQTSQIKEKIRVSCGEKGRDWYNRLEMRKRLR